MAANSTKTERSAAAAQHVRAWDHPLFAGAIHYFRTPRAQWRAVLLGLKDLGLCMVDTYVPWSVHETEPGVFDFGERDDRKNVLAFVQLAAELDLPVILRPGPHINAELTRFGLPAHVLSDPKNLARGPSGNPVPLPAPPIAFPVPSHSSEQFMEATQRWFTAVANHLRPALTADGPVAMVQVDNEAAFYFRDAPYDQDYSAGAVEAFLTFLKKRYRTLANLREAHGVETTKWKDVTPPHHFSAHEKQDLVAHLDWAECQEQRALHGLGQFAAGLHDAGLTQGALLSHNMPMGNLLLPIGPAALQKTVDLPGADYYETRSQLTAVKQRTLRLAGNVKHPFAAELGVGGPPWLGPRNDRDTLQVMLCALAYGLRGFNFYMAADRDRWYGAALDMHGQTTAVGTLLKRLIAGLHEVKFESLQRKATVAIVLPKLYSRLSRITHTLGAISPLVGEVIGLGTAACRQDTFGMRFTVQQHWNAWVRGAVSVLDSAQIPYVFVDSDVDPDQLSEIKALFCPTYTLADREACALAEQFEADGGWLVVGPEAPETDAQMAHLSLTPARPKRLLDLSRDNDKRRATEALMNISGIRTGFEVTSGAANSSLHEGPQGPELVFVTNVDAADTQVVLTLPAPCQLVDLMTGDTFSGHASVQLPVPGQTCRPFRVVLRPVQSTTTEPTSAAESDHVQ